MFRVKHKHFGFELNVILKVQITNTADLSRDIQVNKYLFFIALIRLSALHCGKHDNGAFTGDVPEQIKVLLDNTVCSQRGEKTKRNGGL